MQPSNFIRHGILGEGSYSFVYKVEDKQTHKQYAMKELSKVHLLKNNKVNSLKAEKENLQRLVGVRGIVQLVTTMQDKASLYFLLEYLPGGDLFTSIKEKGTLSSPSVRDCLAQIICIISTLQSHNIIHRDIKPENLVFSEKNRLVLVDFGSSYFLQHLLDRAKTIDGTPEYIPPELLITKSSGVNGDIWGLGMVAYFIYFGINLYHGDSEYLTYSNIKNRDVYIPEGDHPPHFIDLLTSLLEKDENKRLGRDGNITEIKEHPFFNGVDWDEIEFGEDTLPPLSHQKRCFDFSSLNAANDVDDNKEECGDCSDDDDDCSDSSDDE